MRATLILWLLCQAPTVAPSQQESIPKTKANQQEAKTDRRGTQDSPLVVKVLDPENAKERAAQVAQEREQKDRTDRALIWIGAFQVVLFLVQLWMILRGERTTKRQLRAYVSVDSGAIRGVEGGGDMGIMAVVKNYGQTPAHHFAPDLRTEIVDLPGSAPPKMTEHRALLGLQAALGPGATTTIHLTLTRFTADQRAGFARGDKVMFVFGEVRYADAFNTQRSTRFCFVFGGQYGNGSGPLAVAPFGNESD